MPRIPSNYVRALATFEIGLFMVVWSIMVMFFDAIILRECYRQARSAFFPTAKGVITQSELKTERDSDNNPSHRLDVAYDYRVGGQKYTGTRYWYPKGSDSSRMWYAVRNALPVGTRVSVAYNPKNPAESVLHPGLAGFHLYLIWFMIPFNVATIAGWLVVLCIARSSFDPANKRIVIPTPTGWRVPLFNFGRRERFLLVLFVIHSLGIFGWGIFYDVQPAAKLIGWGFVASFATAAFLAMWYRPPWLEVDEIGHVLRLIGGWGDQELQFTAISDVLVTLDEWSDGRYRCELVSSGASRMRLTIYEDRDDAEAFAAWLRERIGLAQFTQAGKPSAALSVP